jgi:hypothetical protein
MGERQAHGAIKAAVYAAMPAAYAAASDNGTLPAPARQIGYAVRRISGLGGSAAARSSRARRTGAARTVRSSGLNPSPSRIGPDPEGSWRIGAAAEGWTGDDWTTTRLIIEGLEERRHNSSSSTSTGDSLPTATSRERAGPSRLKRIHPGERRVPGGSPWPRLPPSEYV